MSQIAPDETIIGRESESAIKMQQLMKNWNRKHENSSKLGRK